MKIPQGFLGLAQHSEEQTVVPVGNTHSSPRHCLLCGGSRPPRVGFLRQLPQDADEGKNDP